MYLKIQCLYFKGEAIAPGENSKPSHVTSEAARGQGSRTRKRKRESSQSSSKCSSDIGGNQEEFPFPNQFNIPETIEVTTPSNNVSSKIDELLDRMPTSFDSCPPNSLRYQFGLIRQCTVIPDSEYIECTKIVQFLTKVFYENFRTNRVTIYRNWHLKLRHPTKDPAEDSLHIYAYNVWSPPEYPNSYSWLSESTISEIFMKSPAKETFQVLNQNFSQGWHLKYKNSAVPIHMSSFSGVMIEAQVCRLLKYMCLFDSRCHPLLTLVHYWVYMNNVPFSTVRNPRNTLAEPLNLQWLVIHFMCHRKYVPTVREIQKRPHQTLKDRITGSDIGFYADLKYAQEWKSMKKKGEKEDFASEDFVLEVVQLFQEFMEFCGLTLDKGKFILNTRDGEVIDINKFVSSELGNGWTTQMTKEELSELMGLTKCSKGDDEAVETTLGMEDQQSINKSKVTDFMQFKLYMVHPFIFSWSFSLPRDMRKILKLMKETGSSLKRYLAARKSNGNHKAKLACGDLQDVLAANRAIPRLRSNRLV